MREALETNEWSLDETSQFEEMGLLDGYVDEDKDDFLDTVAAEEAEMSAELASMKTAILTDGRSDSSTAADVMDEQVEELGRMMGSLQAVKGKHISSFSEY